MATEASRVPCRQRSASKASTSWLCRTSHVGLSGRRRAQNRWTSAATATTTQAVGVRAGLHQAARVATPAPAGPRAMACGMRRLCPLRESSWQTSGATTSIPPAADPASPAPMRAGTPSSPAASPAPTAASTAMTRLVLLRPRCRARGLPATVPRTMAAPTTQTNASAPLRLSATTTASTPSRAPRNRPATHAYSLRRTGAGGALRGGCGVMNRSPCTSWAALCVDVCSDVASADADDVGRELRQCVRTERSASIRPCRAHRPDGLSLAQH